MKTFKNKSIGIIGGMGPQASAKLVQVIFDIAVRDFDVRNNEDFPEVILDSIPVPDFIFNKKSVNRALSFLKKRVKDLEAFNLSYFAIACNTAHILIEDLQDETSIPFISIIDEVTRAVNKAKITKVGLLGTPVTISSGLYEDALNKKRIKVVTPSKRERMIIESVVRNVLAGEIKDVDVQRLMFIGESLRKRGAQCIILGCTELPLIFPKDFVIPVFDSIEILAKALLRNLN